MNTTTTLVNDFAATRQQELLAQARHARLVRQARETGRAIRPLRGAAPLPAAPRFRGGPEHGRSPAGRRREPLTAHPSG